MAEEKERSLVGKVWDYMKDRVAPEIGDMLVQKTAQGAAELSQALNSQSDAFVPYGVGQQQLAVEGSQQSYQDMLREASQRGVQEHGQDMEALTRFREG